MKVPSTSGVGTAFAERVSAETPPTVVSLSNDEWVATDMFPSFVGATCPKEL